MEIRLGTIQLYLHFWCRTNGENLGNINQVSLIIVHEIFR